MYDRKKLNVRNIAKVESMAFLRLIKEHWNDELEFTDVNDNQVKIPQKYLKYFIEETIIAFKQNLGIRIFGVDSMQGFEMNIAGGLKEATMIAKLIWENPQDYYKYEPTKSKYKFSDDDDDDDDDMIIGDDYYDFLKYLWVYIPREDKEYRLADLVNMEDTND